MKYNWYLIPIYDWGSRSHVSGKIDSEDLNSKIEVNVEEPIDNQLCNSEIRQIQAGRVVPTHVFAVRGNRIYRIDRSGGSTTTTPVRTLSETNRGVAVIVSSVIF
ncbi:unnamed protein product [Onchocerca flexuosa]|uniref:Signal peptidase I n=1 Tax=Onchocerca flexuosa TaxID=387005 RepID=A0A183HTX7_9BILA|nr:unnamed protein product [Onchocerca flexuosa]